MTPEQNVIAAAIDFLIADEQYTDCRLNNTYGACRPLGAVKIKALEYLSQAVIAAGIDWLDPAVRERLRKQGVNFKR
jgi:hypothetical protein